MSVQQKEKVGAVTHAHRIWDYFLYLFYLELLHVTAVICVVVREIPVLHAANLTTKYNHKYHYVCTKSVSEQVHMHPHL